MPLTTKLSKTWKEEFAKLMKHAGVTNPNALEPKVPICYEYLRKMSMGKVPSVEVIKRLAEHLNYDEARLMKAAGYNLSFVDKIAEVCSEYGISERDRKRLIRIAKTVGVPGGDSG